MAAVSKGRTGRDPPPPASWTLLYACRGGVSAAGEMTDPLRMEQSVDLGGAAAARPE